MMDCDENFNEMDHDGIWQWHDGEYSLQSDLRNDTCNCLLEELNQDDDSLLYMLGEQTPAKDSMDFGYHVFSTGESASKSSEECCGSSMVKRRRMLQFDSNVDIDIGSEHLSSSIISFKAGEESALLSDELPENLSWVPEYTDQSSEAWLDNCFNESNMQYSSNEMITLVPTEDQIDISEFCTIPSEMDTFKAPQIATPSPRIKFKSRKSFIKAPTTPASVAYPFALVKPCGVQGDVTLHDINRRIHSPPPSKLQNIKHGTLSLHYPTSAISGKPVVAKTKIRTEGGKGSITITRTKG